MVHKNMKREFGDVYMKKWTETLNSGGRSNTMKTWKPEKEVHHISIVKNARTKWRLSCKFIKVEIDCQKTAGKENNKTTKTNTFNVDIDPIL